MKLEDGLIVCVVLLLFGLAIAAANMMAPSCEHKLIGPDTMRPGRLACFSKFPYPRQTDPFCLEAAMDDLNDWLGIKGFGRCGALWSRRRAAAIEACRFLSIYADLYTWNRGEEWRKVVESECPELAAKSE